MRSPRASSVIVALSMCAAAATVALVIGQLTPVERAGAELPIAPISAPDESMPTLGTDPDDDAEEQPPAGESTGGASAPAGTTDGGVTVVAPATPQVIDPGPEPEPEPAPSTPPAETSPGNSGTAPGQGGTHPGNGNANGNANKP